MSRELATDELASTAVRYGPRDVTLLVLVDDYARRILKFQEELSGEGVSDMFWGISDFIGLLELRSAIESGLTSNAQHRSSPIIDAIDQVLLSITVLEREWAQKLDPELPASPWWWSRIPSQGLVADDYAKALARLFPRA